MPSKQTKRPLLSNGALMYFWTCWYTKRFRLIIYVTLATVLSVLGCLPNAFEYRGGNWVLAQMTTWRAAQVWDTGTENTVAILLVILLFAAADLGALALGEDTKHRELDFLLTRPRPRSYFIWTGWLAGVGELIPLLAIPALAAIMIMFYMTRILPAGPLLRLGGAAFAMAAAMFALVYLLATLSGNAQNGFQIAGFVIFLYAGFNYARNEAWFYDDYRGKYYGAFDWLESPHQIFPSANLLLLVGVTLLLPLIAQAGFMRKDL